eukprot:gene5063-7067_t
MGRKRKLFTGVQPIGGHSLKSRRLARLITSQYHNIRNEKFAITSTNIDNDGSKSNDINSNRIKELENKMENIGGIEKYQQASIISTNHFKTSRWVLKTLRELLPNHIQNNNNDVTIEMNQVKSKSNNKISLFEVGAINTQLQQSPWLNVRAIDLHSTNPMIEECDFFDVIPEFNYDAVVCSMVINCVEDPIKRGEMIARLSAHIHPEHGILLLVLPKRCVHSRYVGERNFEELLQCF